MNKRRVFSIGILLAATALFAGAAVFIVRGAMLGETNYDILADVLFPCDAFPVARGEKTVVLRLDDVQAYAWSDTTMQMITEALDRKIPLVLSAIPKDLKTDAVLYRFLRENRCNVEFALHGWDHNTGADGVTPEFRGMSEAEALGRIKQGRNVIETLSREKVTTWVPPNNEQSEGTARAVRSLGIPVQSLEGSGDYDYNAATYDYDTHTLVSATEVVAECNARFETNSICVVMLHPQDFVTDGVLDQEKYLVYTALLDKLTGEGVAFVRFKDLVK